MVGAKPAAHHLKEKRQADNQGRLFEFDYFCCRAGEKCVKRLTINLSVGRLKNVENKTQHKILDAAQSLVQQRGFNAFSYRDLSGIVGIKTSSIHYYFPTKDDLAEKLIERYRTLTKAGLAEIEREASDARGCLEEYLKFFEATGAEQNAICLCGMLSSDYLTLTHETQQQVRLFYAENEEWIAKILDEGRQQEKFKFKGQGQELARLIFSSIEGALLAARMFQSESRIRLLSLEWLRILT